MSGRQSFAVTIVTPPGYAHSEAFREVAESVHHGLLSLGHDSVITTETRLPGRRHIVFGSNLLAQVPSPVGDDAILYNLEQVQVGSPWINPALLELFRRYRTWDYSARNIAELEKLGIHRVQHVPIGYVPELTRIPAAKQDIDVLFVGSVNERRLKILRALKARKVEAHAVFGAYGAARDALIARAKIVLNMHYYEAKVFEIVRVSYLLANGRFVVSEKGAVPEEEAPFASGLVLTDYDRLVETCRRFLGQPKDRDRIAAAGLELMKARPESAYLDRALQSL